MSIFGPMLDGSLVEKWVRDTLELWFDTYATEFELQNNMDRNTLPRPRSWVIAEEVERDAEDQLPAVIVISPGLTGTSPKQEGDGSFRATWAIGVGAFVSASTRPATMTLVRQYVAILRTIMLHRQSLGQNADGIQWMDESYDDNFNWTDRKTISAGQAIFEVEVCGVVNRSGGPPYPIPPSPTTQPGTQWPEADHVLVETDLVSVLPEEG